MMYIYLLFFLVILLSLIALSHTSFGNSILDFFRFFIDGQRYQFSIHELILLWKTSRYADLDDKTRIYWSILALDECIKSLVVQLENASSAVEYSDINTLLSKLYKYRTKVELEQVRKKHRLESTFEIPLGQVCILLFPNKGAHYGKIIESTKFGLKLSMIGEPTEVFTNMKIQPMDITIYFWKADDAGYIVKTKIISSESKEMEFFIKLKQTKNIIRTQKRKSVRAECNFDGLMIPISKDTLPNTLPEKSTGVKCTIKDISEDGALFFIKGECQNNINAKLQFSIFGKQVVMFGKVIRFSYDEKSNLSKVHFQCEKLNSDTKNLVLTFVYNTMPISSIKG